MSWRRRPGGYELWFNRDELHTRAPESAPARAECEGVAFIAPRDGARGGTWLLVNEHGLCACLLNDYASPWRPRLPASRGEVVLACASANSIAGVAARVRAQPLPRIASFQLLALASDGDPLRLHWDGATLREHRGAAVCAPLSSSSYATAEVVAAREARFPAFADPGAYHRQHDPGAGSHSVLMRRPDAATRSICRVSVDGTTVRLDYERVDWSETGPAFTPSRHDLPRSVRG